MSLRALSAKLRGGLVLLTALAAACDEKHPAEGRQPSERARTMSIYTQTAKTLEGKPQPLSEYAGKVTLLVNVASYCGNTPQYAGLERLQHEYAGRGFSVLGFPSNDFGKQEPGTPQEIREFCTSKYQVTFPLFEKVQTKVGPGQSPIYAALEQASGKLPNWNFGKYLIGRDGRVIEYFSPRTDPEGANVVSAIEKALGAPAG